MIRLSDIEWKIRYERESSNLDFKREQYKKEKYESLIKDIMSMANNPVDGSKHIIVGVKETPGGNKEIYPIEPTDFVDVATYQQIVRENIEPTIDFNYYPYDIPEGKIGVFEITGFSNPPYMMKKDYGNKLKKGECYIRKGTQQERMIRRDLDDMLKRKQEKQFDNNLYFGFTKNFDKHLKINRPQRGIFPSDKRKDELERELQELINLEEQSDVLSEISPLHNLGISAYNLLSGGRNADTVKKEIETVKNDYAADDVYYVEEILSNKINFYILNNGNTHLEDVEVIIKVSNKLCRLAEDLPVKLERSNNPLYFNPVNLPSLYGNGYPLVEKNNTEYVIIEGIASLRHKQLQKLFTENLRISFYNSCVGQEVKLSYAIHAKNLPNPLFGELTIAVVE